MNGWRGTLEVMPSDTWQHPSLQVPASAVVADRAAVTVRADTSERVSYHLWVVGWR